MVCGRVTLRRSATGDCSRSRIGWRGGSSSFHGATTVARGFRRCISTIGRSGPFLGSRGSTLSSSREICCYRVLLLEFRLRKDILGCRTPMRCDLSLVEKVQGGVVRRALASLLLAFIVYDITIVEMLSRQVCEEVCNSSDLAGAENVGSPESPTGHPAPSANRGPDHPPSDSSCAEDHCVCCCSHTMPSAAYQTARFDATQLASRCDLDYLPSAPSQELFHPPRIA